MGDLTLNLVLVSIWFDMRVCLSSNMHLFTLTSYKHTHKSNTKFLFPPFCDN